MCNQIFDNFERSEFSDQIFAIFGRALTVATRFDASTKVLARLTLFKESTALKHTLDDAEYEEMIHGINETYTNLYQAIVSLKLDEDIENALHQARISRNDLVHEISLGAMNGFDYVDNKELDSFLAHIKNVVLQIIKGEILISIIVSIHNNEAVPNLLLIEYEARYINWVMERFE